MKINGKNKKKRCSEELQAQTGRLWDKLSLNVYTYSKTVETKQAVFLEQLAERAKRV
jgi:hypothetical protein